MIKTHSSYLTNCIIHEVGNKINDGLLNLSNKELEITDELSTFLNNYFFKHFKSVNEVFRFNHHSSLKLNEVYAYCDNLLENENFIENSANIAKHLYAQTRHQSIKHGELFVAMFNDLIFEDNICSGIGIFKSERKENYLKLNSQKSSISVDIDKGINDQKIDKGCLVLNINYSEGFKVFTYEQNSADTDYWRSDFLNIILSDDRLNKTNTVLALCKEFSSSYVKENYGKQEQVEFLTGAFQYISKTDSFNIEEFENDYFLDKNDKKTFRDFKNKFSEDKNIDFVTPFMVERSYVLQQKKKIKNEIKLDSNFLIKIESNETDLAESLLEKGYDNKRKMNYYKIYFNNEK